MALTSFVKVCRWGKVYDKRMNVYSDCAELDEPIRAKLLRGCKQADYSIALNRGKSTWSILLLFVVVPLPSHLRSALWPGCSTRRRSTAWRWSFLNRRPTKPSSRFPHLSRLKL